MVPLIDSAAFVVESILWIGMMTEAQFDRLNNLSPEIAERYVVLIKDTPEK
jgi:hypothetical protein